MPDMRATLFLYLLPALTIGGRAVIMDKRNKMKKGVRNMATISFDRRIELKPEDVDRFLDIVETPVQRQKDWNEETDEKIWKEGNRKLETYFSRH